MSSRKGHHEVVRTLLEYGADVGVKDKVRNRIMMRFIYIKKMMMMMVVL